MWAKAITDTSGKPLYVDVELSAMQHGKAPRSAPCSFFAPVRRTSPCAAADVTV